MRTGVEARDVFGGVLRRRFTTGSSTTAPAGVHDHTQPGRDLIPVRVPPHPLTRDPPPATCQHLTESSQHNTIRTAPGQRR